jgi:hypothetical protein
LLLYRSSAPLRRPEVSPLWEETRVRSPDNANNLVSRTCCSTEAHALCCAALYDFCLLTCLWSLGARTLSDGVYLQKYETR